MKLLSATATEAVIELTVDAVQVDPVQVEGRTYQRLRVPGCEQTHRPGAPQVPVCSAIIGLPAMTGVSVEVLAQEVDRLAPARLAPAPGLRVLADNLVGMLSDPPVQTRRPDPAQYAVDALYPDHPVDVEYRGYLRDQAIARVRFYPVQFNPVRREVKLFRRIVARLSWDTPLPAAGEPARTGPAFEIVLQGVVLNYDALNRPAAPPFHGAGPATNGVSTAGDSPVLKIGVTGDGLYQLTYEDLTAAGLDPSIVDPQRLRLQNRGADIPIHIQGEADGHFDPVDTLLFYGTAVTGPYTTENVYWLAEGQDLGARMAVRDATPQGAPVPVHFPATLHVEENSFYWQTMPDSLAEDNWFWGQRLTAPAVETYTVSLNHRSAEAVSATMRVRMKGRTTDPALNPDHHTRIHLNGLDLEPGGQWWDGQIIFDHTLLTPQANLAAGENIIGLELVGDTGAAVDQVYLNWIELDYWDRYVAEADELRFGAPASGTFQFEVTGFSRDDIAVFDVTDPANVVRLQHVTAADTGDHYTLKFQDAAQPDSRYLALTSDRRKSPARLELDRASAWRSPDNGADYVIITAWDFFSSTTPLADHRRSAGLRVAQVDVSDLYDEFNAGIFDPQAIRDFLTYAYEQWTPPAPNLRVAGGGCLSGLQR